MGGFFKKAFTLKGLVNVGTGAILGGPVGAIAGVAKTAMQTKAKLDTNSANKNARAAVEAQSLANVEAQKTNTTKWLMIGAAGIAGMIYFLKRKHE